MKFGFAEPQDVEAIAKLLAECNLPSNDLESHIANFLVAREGDRVIGCVGLELEGPLLRSMAVDPAFRSQGIARRLCERLISHAKERGVEQLYLITESAADFFAKAGFDRLDRGAAPESIKKHPQFTELCPSSAVLMHKQI